MPKVKRKKHIHKNSMNLNSFKPKAYPKWVLICELKLTKVDFPEMRIFFSHEDFTIDNIFAEMCVKNYNCTKQLFNKSHIPLLTATDQNLCSGKFYSVQRTKL